jgi:hypothetical protein
MEGGNMCKRMFLIVVLGLVLFTLPMYSQWAKVYGKQDLNFEPSTVLNAHRGGYIAGGFYTDRSNDYSGWGGWIMKITIKGDLEWIRHYSPVLAFTPTSDQGYVAVGWDTIFKIDRFGTLLWHKTVKIERFESCQQTSDGGFITIGRVYRRDLGGGYCLIKFSDIGQIEWKRMFAISDLHNFQNLRIREASDGGFIAVGNTKFPQPYPLGFWIMKLSPKGRIQWQKRFGGMQVCLVNDFVITSQGDYVLMGSYEHVTYDVFDVFNYSNIMVMKIRPDGEIIWQKEYGQFDVIGGEGGYSIINNQDGGFLISGVSYNIDSQFMALKLSSDGVIKWYKAFGGTNSNSTTDVRTSAYSACQAKGGRYIFLGNTDTLGMDWHTPESPRENSIVLLKLKKNGGFPNCPLLGNGPVLPVVDTSYPLIDFRYGFRDFFLKAKDSELIVKDLDVTVVDDVCSWIHQE